MIKVIRHIKRYLDQPYRLRGKAHSVKTTLLNRFAGAAGGDIVRAYWWDKAVNFGDMLTPLLLEHYGLRPVHAPLEGSEVVMVGSILERLPESYAGFIIGSGLIEPESIRRYPDATVLALRGRLTRDRLDAGDDVVLGDPGLLLSLIEPPETEKTWMLGIVPHYSHMDQEALTTLRQRIPDAIRIIDPRRPPEAVLSEIASCRYVLSSSLHGLITADALGIPNRWFVLPDELRGGEFKFHDYYSALDVERRPAVLTGTETPEALVELALDPPASVRSVAERLEGALQAFVAARKASRPVSKAAAS